MKSLRFVFAAALSIPSLAAACELHPLSISGSRAHAGAISITLGEADDAQQPAAWQGPVMISNAGRPVCTVSDDVALLERPLLLGNGHWLFVATYSGSTRRLYAIDTRDCRIAWTGPIFDGHVSYKGDLLVMGRHEQRLSLSCDPPTLPLARHR